jgi:hypothetical protein
MGRIAQSARSAFASIWSSRIQRVRSRAQALVEFALVLTLAIPMLMGVADLGRAMYAVIIIHEAAQNGALIAQDTAWYTFSCQGDVTCANNLVRSAITTTPPPWLPLQNSNITLGGATGTAWTTWAPGDDFTITVSYNFRFITPVLNNYNQTYRAVVRACRGVATCPMT